MNAKKEALQIHYSSICPITSSNSNLCSTSCWVFSLSSSFSLSNSQKIKSFISSPKFDFRKQNQSKKVTKTMWKRNKCDHNLKLFRHFQLKFRVILLLSLLFLICLKNDIGTTFCIIKLSVHPTRNRPRLKLSSAFWHYVVLD